MTDVRFVQYDNTYVLEIMGHAGNPIVCSAVSAIAYMLSGALDNVETKRAIFDKVLMDGYSRIVAVMLDGIEEKAADKIDTLYEAAAVGLLQIGSTYPQNVIVSV